MPTMMEAQFMKTHVSSASAWLLLVHSEVMNRVVELFIATYPAHPDVVVSLLGVLLVANTSIVLKKCSLSVSLSDFDAQVKSIFWGLTVSATLVNVLVVSIRPVRQ